MTRKDLTVESGTVPIGVAAHRQESWRNDGAGDNIGAAFVKFDLTGGKTDPRFAMLQNTLHGKGIKFGVCRPDARGYTYLYVLYEDAEGLFKRIVADVCEDYEITQSDAAAQVAAAKRPELEDLQVSATDLPPHIEEFRREEIEFLEFESTPGKLHLSIQSDDPRYQNLLNALDGSRPYVDYRVDRVSPASKQQILYIISSQPEVEAEFRRIVVQINEAYKPREAAVPARKAESAVVTNVLPGGGANANSRGAEVMAFGFAPSGQKINFDGLKISGKVSGEKIAVKFDCRKITIALKAKLAEMGAQKTEANWLLTTDDPSLVTIIAMAGATFEKDTRTKALQSHLGFDQQETRHLAQFQRR